MPENFPHPLGRISPPPADVRATDTSWVKETRLILSKRRERMRKQKVIRQLPNDINERFESPSLDGTARPVFPTGLARPNAAFGRRDSASLSKEFLSSLEARIAKASCKAWGGSLGEATAPPSLLGGERRGAPARLPLALAEVGASERREAREKFFSLATKSSCRASAGGKGILYA